MKLDYVCKICNTPFTWANQLSIHLKKVHNETCQTYYDKFLKTDLNEGLCECCGKPTKFIKFSHGYNKYCSITCGKEMKNEKRRNFYRTKYNDNNIVNNTCVPGAVQEMWKRYEERTGYKHNMLNPEVQIIWKENYFIKTGFKHNFSDPKIIEKRKLDYKNKTGYDNPFQNPIVKEKIKQSNLTNLGVEYAPQSKEVYNKIKKYFNRKLWC